jgi:glucose-1-phosphate cytidylyltransferase
MKVVILAGGMGTRLQEETVVKPKPMVEIGGYPIIWHIMNIYACAGYNEFIIALGYKSEYIKSYFYNYHHLRNNFSVNLKDGSVEFYQTNQDDWKVHLIDTGIQTMTGGRIKRLAPIIGNEPFMVTYGDGVANLDIKNLVEFHKKQKSLATVTAVRPPARFGGLSFEGNLISQFIEKPQIGEGWINGGFFVLEPEIMNYIDDDKTIFEREPLERLAREKKLAAYQHDDFWQCMDTLRDVHFLEEVWSKGKAPWKMWD